MTDYYVSYGVVAVLAIVAVLFAVGTLAIWRVVRPSRPNAQKLMTYECGIDAIGETWTQPNVRYYLFAFLFVVFDVEALFLFPWALVYERLGIFVVVEMILFVGVLIVGLAYAWGRRVLDWA